MYTYIYKLYAYIYMCINRHTDWRGTCVSMPRFRYGPRTLQSPLLSLLISYIKKTAVKYVSFLIL